MNKYPERLALDSTQLARLKSGNLKDGLEHEPLFRLYVDLARQDGVSAFTICPNLLQNLKSQPFRNRIIGDERTPNPVSKNDHYKYPILSFSLPAVDEGRGEAIMLGSEVFGLFGGGGNEVYLRRNDLGKWRVLYSQQRWIS